MFKTYGFWTALAGMLTIVISALGKIFGFAVEDGIVTEIVMAIAGFLVAIGVIALPKEMSKDADDKEDVENNEDNSDNEENKEDNDKEE